MRDRWGAVTRHYLLPAMSLGILVILVSVLMTSIFSKPLYSASATIETRLEGGAKKADFASAAWADILVSTAQTLITSPKVLLPAGKAVTPNLSVQEVKKKISFSMTPHSMSFVISITSLNKDQAVTLINAIIHEFRAQIALDPIISPYGLFHLSEKSAIVVQQLRHNPGILRTWISSIVAGLASAFALILVAIIFDNRIRNRNQLAAITDSSVIANLNANPSEAEYAQLAKNLKFVAPDPKARRVAITSISRSASPLVEQLGKSLNSSNTKFIMVDADLHKRPLGNQEPGLSNVLIGEAPLQMAVIDQLLSAGSVPPNPTELINSDTFMNVLTELQDSYDLVLVNCPPILSAPDAAALSSQVDTVLIVITMGVDKESTVSEALSTITTAGGNIGGLILIGSKSK